MNSEHGGLHFYSHHLIEEMLEVFGDDVEYISAELTGGKLTATAHYKNFPVIMNYAVAFQAFYAAVYGEKTSMTKNISTDGLDAVQADRFINAVKCGKSESNCGGRMVSAVKISCALEKAIKENRRINIQM